MVAMEVKNIDYKLQILDFIIKALEQSYKNNMRQKYRIHNKTYEIQKWEKLKRETWMRCNENKYWIRYQYSKRKTYAKQQTNRRLRQDKFAQISRKGLYRRWFDYWWEIF